LDKSDIPDRSDPTKWPELRHIFAAKFESKTQREWEDVFDGTDSCVTAVKTLFDVDNRPVARLSESPALAISGIRPNILKAGDGGSTVLQQWVGWEENRDYVVDGHGTVMNIGQTKL